MNGSSHYQMDGMNQTDFILDMLRVIFFPRGVKLTAPIPAI